MSVAAIWINQIAVAVTIQTAQSMYLTALPSRWKYWLIPIGFPKAVPIACWQKASPSPNGTHWSLVTEIAWYMGVIL